MVTSPLIPLPRLRSGLIMPFLFNRGDVRKMFATLPSMGRLEKADNTLELIFCQNIEESGGDTHE